jgi:hypothetical protein
MTSEGSPGLQAGKKSVPAKRAKELRRARSACLQHLFRLCVRSCKGEDGVQMPGIPRRDAAAGAVAHVRLRPPRMEPDPRRPARPLASRAHGHQLRADRPGTDRTEEGPGPGVPEPDLLGPAPAGIAASAQGVLRVLRQARPLPAVQVPPLPPVRALHPVGVQASCGWPRQGRRCGSSGRGRRRT